MNRSTFQTIKYMNGSVLFSKARYMNRVGFEILHGLHTRTSITPKLSNPAPPHPPPPPPPPAPPSTNVPCTKRMLPGWQKLVFIQVSHVIWAYYMFKQPTWHTFKGHGAIITSKSSIPSHCQRRCRKMIPIAKAVTTIMKWKSLLILTDWWYPASILFKYISGRQISWTTVGSITVRYRFNPFNTADQNINLCKLHRTRWDGS